MKNADCLDVVAYSDLLLTRFRGGLELRATNQRPRLCLHTQEIREWQAPARASEQDSSHARFKD